MKITLIRTDKEKEQHLSVKSAEWFFDRIKSDTKAGVIGKLRQHVALFGDMGDWAKTVTMVFPSVEMKKTANGRLEVTAFNSVVTLLVEDLMRSQDITAVKEAAAKLPMTMAVMTGADGRTVVILVAVEAQDGRKPQTEDEMDQLCRSGYETAFAVYGGILPGKITHQPVSARSAFLLPLDEEPYYNPAYTPLKVGGMTAVGKEQETVGQQETDMSLYAVYEQIYRRAVEEAYEATDGIISSQWTEAYITELFRRLCMAGVPEEEAFLHVRNHHQHHEDYDEDVFRSIEGAVYAEVKPRRNYADGVSRETRRMINFLNTRYVFRHNQVMGYTEYRPNNTWVVDWQACDEKAINGLTIEARLSGLDVRDNDVRRYVRSNMIRAFDPVGDFMMRVADRWDGQTDHIAMLARCIPCDIPQWEQWFRKWFLSMVAQWLLPRQEYGNSIVPLLISPQGDGKTTFCRNILPPELRWGFLENLDVSEKRQTLQAMHNFLLINLDEFNQISPKLQEGFLKNVIQLPRVKIKRPYGKHVEEFHRFASFIATTNEGSVLSDPTGNRRFICVQLRGPVDTDYKPNYEALYGQAYQLVMRHREAWWFTPEEVKAVMKHNRQFEVVPPAVQYFREHYEIATDENDGEWLTATAIYEHLRSIAGSGLKANGVAAFGRYLKNIPGIQTKRQTRGVTYLVSLK